MVNVTKRFEANANVVSRYEDAYQVWKKIFHSLSTGGYHALTEFQEKYRHTA